MDQNKIAYEYNKSILKNLNYICSPLFENTPIKSFRYWDFLNDTTQTFLSTQDEVERYILLETMTNGPNFQKTSQKCLKDDICFFIWPLDIKEIKNDFMLQKYLSLNIYGGLTIYEKIDSKNVRGWCFGSTVDYNQLANFYINNLNTLKNFSIYINDKIREIEKDLGPIPISNINNKSNKPNDFLTDYENINIEFSKNPLIPIFNSLPSRQKECLNFLSQGKTIKEIANSLGISPRTVEEYLSNSKVRLNMFSKNELIKEWSKFKSYNSKPSFIT